MPLSTSVRPARRHLDLGAALAVVSALFLLAAIKRVMQKV